MIVNYYTRIDLVDKMGKKKRSDYIILSKKIGFIIETNNVDVSCYQRRTEGLSHS